MDVVSVRCQFLFFHGRDEILRVVVPHNDERDDSGQPRKVKIKTMAKKWQYNVKITMIKYLLRKEADPLIVSHGVEHETEAGDEEKQRDDAEEVVEAHVEHCSRFEESFQSAR